MLKLLKIPNVRLLFIAQALGMATAPFNTLLGGIVGARLAPDLHLATLPIALMIVGLASGTVPVALLMRRQGRRFGFMVAAGVSLGGALLAAVAIERESFWLFCLAATLLGVNAAAIQQYRFAVTENVAPADVPRAVSLVLLGTLVAAFLGPFLAQSAEAAQGIGRDAIAYLMLGSTLMISLLLLSKYRDVAVDPTHHDGPARPLREIISQPVFIVALLAAAIGYGVMTFLMTATPVSMHVMDGHSLAAAAGVIQAHIVAMYLPSLFSGWLIHRFGEKRLLLSGIALLLACSAAAAQGHEVMHYGVALVLLGVGWNFLFVGGTTLLTRTYRASERFRVQALNDFAVFSLTATASLASGAAVQALGWNALLWIVIVPSVLLAALVAVGLRRTPLRTA
jgi:MFS family permease